MPHIPIGINLIVILAVALLVFGPDKLPEIARTLAKTMNEVRNAMHDVTQQFDLTGARTETRVHATADYGVRAGGEDHAVTAADPYSGAYAGGGALSSPESQGGQPVNSTEDVLNIG